MSNQCGQLLVVWYSFQIKITGDAFHATVLAGKSKTK